MKYVRIYADATGASHLEDVEMNPPGTGADLSDQLGASGVFFRTIPAGTVNSWHNAPRRQFVFVLQGEAEVQASDGATRRVGPGGVILAEDTTGKGHITSTVSQNDRVMAFVPLNE